jgi:hypothetical protein
MRDARRVLTSSTVVWPWLSENPKILWKWIGPFGFPFFWSSQTVCQVMKAFTSFFLSRSLNRLSKCKNITHAAFIHLKPCLHFNIALWNVHLSLAFKSAWGSMMYIISVCTCPAYQNGTCFWTHFDFKRVNAHLREQRTKFWMGLIIQLLVNVNLVQLWVNRENVTFNWHPVV